MASNEPEGADPVAAAEQKLAAFEAFEAEAASLDAAVSAHVKADLSAGETADVSLVLMRARSELHELAQRRRGPPPGGDFNTTADALLWLSFVRPWLACCHSYDAVAADPVGLPLAGLVRVTRQMERLRDEFREVLAARGKEQPGGARLRVFQDDAG